MSSTPTWPDPVGALHRAIMAEEDTWDDTAIHASDLGATIPGEGCLRQVWLRVRGTPRKPQTLGEALMFDHGHRIHERVGKLLEAGLDNGWKVVGIELPVEGLPEGLTGQLDLLLEHESGRRQVWDMKTQRGRAFSYMDGAKPGHELQCQTYMSGENVDADEGGILYIDREGSNMAAAEPVARDDEAVRSAARALREAVEQPIAPPILLPQVSRRENKGPDSLYLKMPWPCDYCPFLDVSCPGALQRQHRDLGIVAKDKKPGIEWKTEDIAVMGLVEQCLHNQRGEEDEDRDS